MKNKIFIICSIFIFISVNLCFSQEKSHLKDINTHVWIPFTKSYETYDYSLFSSIHSQELVRISADGKSIKAFPEYIESYKNRWKNSEKKQTISFRFIERIVNNAFASERGIYKLTVNLNTSEEKSYYGKFHVLLKRVNGKWKIIMDYDSSERNTINEASYNLAFEIDAFEKF
jgi:ketosteroid isomerase-like protein